MQISEIKIIQCSICHKTDTIHLPIHSIFQKNLHGVLTASGTIHLNIDQFLPITKLPCTRRDQAAPLPQANRSGEDPPGSAYLHPPGLDHKKMTVIHHVRLCLHPVGSLHKYSFLKCSTNMENWRQLNCKHDINH